MFFTFDLASITCECGLFAVVMLRGVIRLSFSDQDVAQSLVRPAFVVVCHVRRNDVIEVLLTKDYEVVEGLVLQALDEAFHESVQVRRLRPNFLQVNVAILEDLLERIRKLFVEIPQYDVALEILTLGVSEKSLRLRDHPICIWLEASRRHKDAARANMNESQGKDLPRALDGPDPLAEEVQSARVSLHESR